MDVITKKTLTKIVAGVAIAAASQSIFAMDLGSIASNFTGQFNSVGKMMQALAALFGIGLIIAAVFTFIKYNKTEGQGAKLSTGFFLMVGGICLFYIASIIQTGGDTTFGSGGGDRSTVQVVQ